MSLKKELGNINPTHLLHAFESISNKVTAPNEHKSLDDRFVSEYPAFFHLENIIYLTVRNDGKTHEEARLAVCGARAVYFALQAHVDNKELDSIPVIEEEA